MMSLGATLIGLYAIYTGDITNGLLLLILGELTDMPKIEL